MNTSRFDVNPFVAALHEGRTALAESRRAWHPPGEEFRAAVEQQTQDLLHEALRTRQSIDVAEAERRAQRQVTTQYATERRAAMARAQEIIGALNQGLANAKRQAMARPRPPVSLTEAQLKAATLNIERFTLESIEASRQETLLLRIATETAGMLPADLVAALETAEAAGNLLTASYLEPRVEQVLSRLQPQASAQATTATDALDSLTASQREVAGLRARHATVREARLSEADRTAFHTIETDLAAARTELRRELDVYEAWRHTGERIEPVDATVGPMPAVAAVA